MFLPFSPPLSPFSPPISQNHYMDMEKMVKALERRVRTVEVHKDKVRAQPGGAEGRRAHEVCYCLAVSSEAGTPYTHHGPCACASV